MQDANQRQRSAIKILNAHVEKNEKLTAMIDFVKDMLVVLAK